VTLDVEGRVARAGFVVQAGEVRVRVVGTKFTVSRRKDWASVGVERGAVDIDVAGKTVRVHAGETWRSADASETTPAPSDEATAIGPLSALAGAASSSPDASNVFARERAGGRRGGPGGGHGGPRVAASPPDSPVPTASSAVLLPPGRSSQELFEEAARIEVSDPIRAIRIYRQLAAQHDARGEPWAANALFARGRLLAALGAPVEARATLSEYLSRFPRGPNAEDARLLLDRLR
jgi:hypothetical protein